MDTATHCLIQGDWMHVCQWRVPNPRRVWRLETELREDGFLSESESESEDESGAGSELEGSEETHWGTDSSDKEPESLDSDDWDDERDWYLENEALGSLPQ